jgi:hypothetical protein
MEQRHISEDDLERYDLGMVADESECAQVEEHLLWCPSCLDRLEKIEQEITRLRRVLIRADCDIDFRPPDCLHSWDVNN